MRNLRELIERLAFAGLSPGAPARPPLRERLRRRFERLVDRLAGTPPPVDDPLVESHRTWRQSVKVALYLAAPFLLGLVLLLYSTDLVWHRNRHQQLSIPSIISTQLSQEVLQPSQLEVVRMSLVDNSGSPVIDGSVRNNSGESFESAEISFNITDKDGMVLGAVSTTVRGVPPHGIQTFRIPVPHKNAAIVLVRDARRL